MTRQHPARRLAGAGAEVEDPPRARAARGGHRVLEHVVGRHIGADLLRIRRRVEVVLPVQRLGQLALADRAGPHHRPLAVRLVAAQVDHRRRRAGQLTAVDHQVHRRPQQRGHVLQPAGIRPAGAVGARLQHRPAHAGEPWQRPAPAPRASTRPRRRRARTARPGWARARSPAPGSTRVIASRVRSPSSGIAANASSTPQNMTADGLSSARRLSRYSRSTANRSSGSQASPYTVSAGNRTSPPTPMHRSNAALSALNAARRRPVRVRRGRAAAPPSGSPRPGAAMPPLRPVRPRARPAGLQPPSASRRRTRSSPSGPPNRARSGS